jgi:hypothetical protein
MHWYTSNMELLDIQGVSFTLSRSTAVLSHEEAPASGVSLDSQRAHGHDKKDTLLLKPRTRSPDIEKQATFVANSVTVYQCFSPHFAHTETQHTTLCYTTNLSHVTTLASQATNIFLPTSTADIYITGYISIQLLFRPMVLIYYTGCPFYGVHQHGGGNGISRWHEIKLA